MLVTSASAILASAAVITSSLTGVDLPAQQQNSPNSLRLETPLQITDSQLQVSQRQPARSGLLTAKNTGSWINIRTQPTVQSSVRGYGFTGEEVNILQDMAGLHDSYRWYLVQFPGEQMQGWIRGDLIRERAASLRESQELPITSSPVNREAQEIAAAPTPRAALGYTPEEISYFTEIALGSEFGRASQRIRKWGEDIRIRVHGTPTVRDRTALASVVSELDQLLHSSEDGISVEVMGDRDTRRANVDIYFVPHQEFRRYEPNYQPGNLGFAYVNWSQDQIYRGRILITTTGVSQAERSHLIREELTQSLGLLQDSSRYEDSIFYQGWTRTNTYSSLDVAVIQMLYDRSVRPGMDSREVRTALERVDTLTVLPIR